MRTDLLRSGVGRYGVEKTKTQGQMNLSVWRLPETSDRDPYCCSQLLVGRRIGSARKIINARRNKDCCKRAIGEKFSLEGI